ncbi:orotate phosphoribosyltransferase [Uliginosibacterium aquaticum]|uniref:Orotate phosphoribosyltransferase n=1 Tax=Uliginosibacterium aquaticum TaxID=2731212 RepID=A0ABX2IPM1_9RHOO|nr:orotate phosphoribosyltransferase [Uliginosibacterium aquaticum]NSL56198.1 orotate phosphoribosyltransferase [Uliginosibacterium aquaticum]
MDFSRDFLALAERKGVLRFGEFKTKAGRLSPYFFNTALFDDGASFGELCRFYAQAIGASGIAFDTLFGPAYKGIPLAAGTAMQMAAQGRNIPFCFNRKEAKDHGEGGTLVGAPLKGRVIVVDDVISAGTSVRESVEIIRANGAELAGVVIAIDRMERGTGAKSAAQEVRDAFGVPVVAVATLDDLMAFIADDARLTEYLPAVQTYRTTYGVS